MKVYVICIDAYCTEGHGEAFDYDVIYAAGSTKEKAKAMLKEMVEKQIEVAKQVPGFIGVESLTYGTDKDGFMDAKLHIDTEDEIGYDSFYFYTNEVSVDTIEKVFESFD